MGQKALALAKRRYSTVPNSRYNLKLHFFYKNLPVDVTNEEALDLTPGVSFLVNEIFHDALPGLIVSFGILLAIARLLWRG